MSVSGRPGAERRYSVPSNPFLHDPRAMQSEDLHAWSIYRQNLNSDFTDSALGSTDKSPLPYGNFQLRDTTVQSILSHPRYGPKSALGSNMYTYLKFGLPRVFPPNHNGSQRSGTPRAKTSIGSEMKPVPRVSRVSRGNRENSSGYDSSDNETSQQYKYNRKYRSDPDFRLQNLQPSYPGSSIPLVAMHQAGIRAGPGQSHQSNQQQSQQSQQQWTSTRNKSVSEANLLAMETRNYGTRQSYNNRRNSMAEFGNDGEHSQIGRPMSKADSHLSLMQTRKGHHHPPSVMRGDYGDSHAPHTSYIYPNLQIKNLEIASSENPSMLLVSGISCEAKAGEILAIMATAEGEATGLLNVLAGIGKKLSGDIILNGQPVSKATLKNATAYVRNNINICPDMTVVQTLKFHAQLKWPNAKMSQVKVDAKDRINILIEELGLEQVRLTNVGRLTRSELRRLNVACHMLLDTVILILDQPTKEMDIFDTFFLIEYLRNWASTGRIVILTLHPPTYEIFAMLSKVVLISAGRTMFSGYRRDLIPYFASIDYPCPAFKNPSDYYLDLVTLDDLSAAAMLESSGRIEQLAEVFRSAHARVRGGEGEGSLHLVPPIPLPSPVCKANPVSQAWMLVKKTLLYTQPNTIISWITRLILAAIVSLITGAIFWDLPASDAGLTQHDRLGYHYAAMCVCVWPLLLLLVIKPIHSQRKFIERDIDIGLYGRTVFFLTDTITDMPPTVCIWLAYLIPSYSMSGLYMQGFDNYNGFYLYLGYMVLYLCCIKMFVKAVTYVIPSYKWSSYTSAVLLTISFIACGYTIHHLDMTPYTRWLEYVSPARWVMSLLLGRELSPQAIQTNQIARCRNKQVQKQDIIVQVHCPTPNGTQVLLNTGYERSNYLWEYAEESTVIALVIFWVVCFLVSCAAFVFDCCRYGKRLTKQSGRGNKCTPNTP